MAQGVTKIAQVRSLSGSLKQYLWELVIPRVPGGSDVAGNALSLRCRNVQIPGYQIQKVFSHFKGHRIPRPSKPIFPTTLEVVFEEGLDLSIISALSAWRTAWLNEETGVGSSESEIQVDSFLNIVDHADEIVGTFTLKKMWPENVPDIAATYESEALVQPTVTFCYDRWQFNLAG
jgi:hypothetical protein